jgi:hypothetical protein
MARLRVDHTHPLTPSPVPGYIHPARFHTPHEVPGCFRHPHGSSVRHHAKLPCLASFTATGSQSTGWCPCVHCMYLVALVSSFVHGYEFPFHYRRVSTAVLHHIVILTLCHQINPQLTLDRALSHSRSFKNASSSSSSSC